MDGSRPTGAIETTPLLESIAGQTSKPSTNTFSGISLKLHSHFQKWSTLYICGLMVFLVDFGEYMGEGARLHILELGICREYYELVDPHIIGSDGGISEKLCKLDQIQSELAKIRGFLGLLDHISGKDLSRSSDFILTSNPDSLHN